MMLSGVALMVAEFHRKYPVTVDIETHRDLRYNLHEEEAEELQDALNDWHHRANDRTLKALAQELADVVYVCYGTASVAGIDLDKAIAEVHRANMSKLRTDRKPIVREDGKILKGPNYEPPDMSVAVRPHVSEATEADREEFWHGDEPPHSMEPGGREYPGTD